MNRRGFFGTLAALIGATIVGRPRDPGPEALHLRFDHHGPATKIRWTQEGAYIESDENGYYDCSNAPIKFNVDSFYDGDSWRTVPTNGFVLLKEKP